MFTNANYADKERMEYAMEKIKVLVVDDESRMRKLVSDFLTRDGYEVIEAGDGEEAVEIFFQNKDIAVILLDVMMPKMNGWQVLKTIRRTLTCLILPDCFSLIQLRLLLLKS